MKTITVVVKEPGKPAEAREIEPTLESYQTVVGGFITRIGFLWKNTAMLMDEEGDLKSKQDNIKAPPHILTQTAAFRGTVFVCGEKNNDFASLPSKYIQEAIDYLNEKAVS